MKFEVGIWSLSLEWSLELEVGGWNSKLELDTCRAPLHEKCSKHHELKGDPGTTPRTCGAIDERAQVILVWMRTLSIGNAFHPRRQQVMTLGHLLCVA